MLVGRSSEHTAAAAPLRAEEGPQPRPAQHRGGRPAQPRALPPAPPAPLPAVRGARARVHAGAPRPAAAPAARAPGWPFRSGARARPALPHQCDLPRASTGPRPACQGACARGARGAERALRGGRRRGSCRSWTRSGRSWRCSTLAATWTARTRRRGPRFGGRCARSLTLTAACWRQSLVGRTRAARASTV
jgi:hypothetical protein